MTIASSTRKAGPFAGDGLTTDFAFAFKVFDDSDLYVVKAATSTGVETVLTLTTDYTVALNADQNTSPGGTVTLLTALASGYTLTLTSSLGYLQPTDLTNQGGFYPQVITNALDRLTILTQQLKEKLDRAAVVPISSSITIDELTADLITVADDLTNINTVAGIASNVTTVAGVSADVTTAATNITSISNFADIYYGPSATDPATRKDGSALQEGDIYFNTATNLMRVRTAVSGWLDAQTPVPISITTQTFSGTGAQVAFTLSGAPAFLNAVEVAISGVVQIPTTDYTLSGTTLTFTSAPPSGTNNVFVRWYAAYSGGVPNDGSVTAAKLVSGMVIQEVEATPYTTYSATPQVIPYDDTIPQSSEGTEYLTVTITPAFADSRLVVEADAGALYAPDRVVMALFRDSGANAIAVAGQASSDAVVAMHLRHEEAAGSVSATTFKLRMGPSTSTGSGILTVNGTSSARRYGGKCAVRLRVKEIKA